MKMSKMYIIILYFLLIPLIFVVPFERVYADSNAVNSSTKYKVYILAGQSNMAGIGMNHELSSEYLTILDNVKIYPEGSCDDSLKGVWSKLGPGFGGGAGCFGPELTFGKDISKAYPDSQILLIKCGWSATSLQGDWLSPSAGRNTGRLYTNLMSTIDKALTELGPNIDYEISGMCWMQGESDACSVYSAKEYESNLTNFINDIRKDIKKPTLPFIIGMIDDSSTWAENAIVRQAEINISKNVPYIGIFDTKDFDTDGSHYKTQGIIDMGSAFAKTMIAMSSPSNIIYGDANNDSTVDSADYTLFRSLLLGKVVVLPNTNWKKDMDLNKDGIVDSADYTLLRKYLLKIITKIPV